jgi:hypothetical protein
MKSPLREGRPSRHGRVLEAIILRTAAAGVLAAVLAVGSWLAGKQGRDSAKRMAAVQDGRADQEQALEDASAIAAREMRGYEAALVEDAQALELEPPPLSSITAPNLHVIALQDAVTLRPGEPWTSEHLVIRAEQDKVTYQRHGASVAATHLVALVENVASVPVAYNVRVRSAERGRCDVRGTRSHNAIALRPGEVASIVVCAGRGALSLEHVEVLELTEIGHRFVSSLPTAALGLDPVTAQAHRPPAAGVSCETTDARRLAAAIEAGQARWVDVADFYSRHNCTRWAFPPGYRHATGPLTRLPITADGRSAP